MIHGGKTTTTAASSRRKSPLNDDFFPLSFSSNALATHTHTEEKVS